MHEESMCTYLLGLVGMKTEFNQAIQNYHKNKSIVIVINRLKSQGRTLEIERRQEE